MVMVMIHMTMMEIIPTTSHASDQYLAHRVSSHTKGGRIQPDTTRSSITPRMAPILGGDHRKQFFPIFGRFSIVILGVQVFLCKTHPYGRLESCWDWGLGGPGIVIFWRISSMWFSFTAQNVYDYNSTGSVFMTIQCAGLRACGKPHFLRMAGQHQSQDQRYKNGSHHQHHHHQHN